VLAAEVRVPPGQGEGGVAHEIWSR
jgi:hypothetical protein